MAEIVQRCPHVTPPKSAAACSSGKCRACLAPRKGKVILEKPKASHGRDYCNIIHLLRLHHENMQMYEILQHTASTYRHDL